MPPTGTPGAIPMGEADVVIGGFPRPGWGAAANGLLKVVKGLRGKHRSRGGRSARPKKRDPG